MTDKELMEQALDALNLELPSGAYLKLRDALGNRLAQPEQEPVAWRYRMPVEDGHWVWNYATYIDDPKDQRCEPLYTTPPQRKPLTFEEILAIAEESRKHVYPSIAFARAIEAAHGIKE